MTLTDAYVTGRVAAFSRYKLGWPAPTNPTVAGSGVLRARETSPSLSPEAQQNMRPPTDPQQVAQIFSAHEQGESRSEPHRKLSADICTTCRKAKHYGPCSQPRTIPEKAADFNPGMLGSDPTQGDNPSTSPHYHSAVSSISALGRSSDGRPADDQAASGFADLFRHQGIRNSADEPGRMTGGLHKVAIFGTLSGMMGSMAGPLLGGAAQGSPLAKKIQEMQRRYPPPAPPSELKLKQPFNARAMIEHIDPPKPQRHREGPVGPGALPTTGVMSLPLKLGDFMMPGAEGHSMHEQRGPSVNPYEERRTRMSPPVGWGDEGEQRIDRMFRQFDNQVDTTNIGGGFGDPQPGPAALG